MGRVTMRDPDHPGWPDRGERTEVGEVAEKWRWKYYDLALTGTRNRQLDIPAARTLEAARDEYIEHRERTVEPQTVKSDRYAIAAIIDKVGADTIVYDVTKEQVQDMLDGWLDGGYSRTTVQTLKVYLSGFFRWAGLDPNPARKAVVPKPEEREIFAWSDAEIERLRSAADKVDREDPTRLARLLLDAGLATGARFRELLALRWEDFNPQMRTVRIARQVAQYRRGTKLPKSRRGRTAVVLPFFWEHYREGARGSILPSPAGGGRHMSSKSAELSLKRTLELAELDGPQRAFHDLRRTYGRLFLEMGGWMDELQRSLGHRNAATTERLYGKFQEEVAAQFAVDRVYGEGRARRLRVV
jgi:integrase